jgi:hypothetical protein
MDNTGDYQGVACGHRVRAGSRFCQVCGQPVGQAVADRSADNGQYAATDTYAATNSARPPGAGFPPG